MLSKLRHPVRAIREPFGTAGLIIACVALIAALAGGAYAASGGLTAKQKKEVKKIAKQFAGKPGPTGAAGPQGNPGPAGANGKDGANGTNGSNGTNGVSPTGIAFAAAKGGCTEGGIEFKGANTTFACNGVKGQTGFTTTLPAGKTEMGHWAWGSSPTGPNAAPYNLAPISFVIPYPDPAGPELVYLKGNETADECDGTAAEPKADPGYLCVYENADASTPNITFKPDFTQGAGGTDAAGVTLWFESKIITITDVVWNVNTEEPEKAELQVPQSQFAAGTWAVTAPAAP